VGCNQIMLFSIKMHQHQSVQTDENKRCKFINYQRRIPCIGQNNKYRKKAKSKKILESDFKKDVVIQKFINRKNRSDDHFDKIFARNEHAQDQKYLYKQLKCGVQFGIQSQY